MEGVRINTMLGDFSFMEQVSEPYDAVLFFECFHHASNHLALMAAFERCVKNGGIVCFAAEPITSEFPIPWGLRMDGQSIWAIRKNGWLELGFNDKYFRSALERFGWRALDIRGKDSHLAHVVMAKRKADWGGVFKYTAQGLQSQIGTVSEHGCVADGREGYIAYGPYISLPPGSYRAEVLLSPHFPFSGNLHVDVVIDHGATCLADLNVESMAWPSSKPLMIEFESGTQMQNVEVRVRCAKGTELCIEAITVNPI
jgi:hypothetical protein